MIVEEGSNFRSRAVGLAPLCRAPAARPKYDFDEAELEPYLKLDNVICRRLRRRFSAFSVSPSRSCKGLKLYRPEVRVWRVTGKDGRFIGIFIGRLFCPLRPSAAAPG